MVKVSVQAGAHFGWMHTVDGVEGAATSRRAAAALKAHFPGLAGTKLNANRVDALRSSMNILDRHGMFSYDYQMRDGKVPSRMPMSRLLLASSYVTYNYGIAVQFAHFRGGGIMPALPALGIEEKSTVKVYGDEVAEALRLNHAHAEWLRDSGMLGTADLSVAGMCDLVNRYDGARTSKCGFHVDQELKGYNVLTTVMEGEWDQPPKFAVREAGRHGGGGGEAEVALADGSVLAFTSTQNKAMEHGVIGGKSRAGLVPPVRYVSSNRDIQARDLALDSARWRLLVSSRVCQGGGGGSAEDLNNLLVAHEEMEFAWMRPWMEQTEQRRAALQCWHGVWRPMELLLLQVDARILEAVDYVQADGGPRGCRVRAAVACAARKWRVLRRAAVKRAQSLDEAYIAQEGAAVKGSLPWEPRGAMRALLAMCEDDGALGHADDGAKERPHVAAGLKSPQQCAEGSGAASSMSAKLKAKRTAACRRDGKRVLGTGKGGRKVDGGSCGNKVHSQKCRSMGRVGMLRAISRLGPGPSNCSRAMT